MPTEMQAAPIAYSRGKSTTDNKPAQRHAATFGEFAHAVLSDLSKAKGAAYVCAAMSKGQHTQPEKHKGEAPWRLKHLVQPRAFLPFDFDGFDSPDTAERVCEWLQRFQGFGYYTASSTPQAPRMRVVLAQSRATDRAEGEALGRAIQCLIQRDIGPDCIKFDESVYRAEQPLFTPLLGAQTIQFAGSPVDVDAVLAAHVPADDSEAHPKPSAVERAASAASSDPVLAELERHGMVKRDLGTGKYAVQCPCVEDHTGDSGESSTVYFLPNFGGVKYGKFHCLHNHCESREQEEFLKALGLNPRDVWAAQRGESKPEKCNYAGGEFSLSSHGVSFIGRDKQGDALPPQWICAPLHVRAMTRDAKSGKWGRLLEWDDSDGVRHQWAMPMELLQGDGADVRRELADKGLRISPTSRARELLGAYLQVWPVDTRARCVDRLGWHGGVYVAPNEAIGQRDEVVVFQNAAPLEPAHTQAGTVDQWRDSVARLAAGNSRLVFAISVAFAAPLAELIGEDGGGFHLRGASSSGKSTALKVAASVWGCPDAYPRLWRATANGLEGLATLHNDGLLILDELGQIDAKEAGEAAYMFANGQGKARASRTGAARQSARWRLLLLSAGEIGLADHMRTVGKRANVGQEVRIADIAADAGAGLGAFENLHELPSGAALSQAIKDAAARAHGAVGLEWLRQVVPDRIKLAATLSDGVRRFVGDNVPAGAAGQVQRVARRFGLAAVAGELASGSPLIGDTYGLTGWDEGEATAAARKCFATWFEHFGGATGNREDEALLSQVRAFFEAHGASRFASISDEYTDGRNVPNRVGFVRSTPDGGREYLVLSEAFKTVCTGFDPKAAAKVLREAGWLIPGGDGRNTQKPRIHGEGTPRVYVFGAGMLA